MKIPISLKFGRVYRINSNVPGGSTFFVKIVKKPRLEKEFSLQKKPDNIAKYWDKRRTMAFLEWIMKDDNYVVIVEEVDTELFRALYEE